MQKKVFCILNLNMKLGSFKYKLGQKWMTWWKVMTQNWSSEIISSLITMYYENIDTMWHWELWLKNWYNFKNLRDPLWFFLGFFWPHTVLIHPDQNLPIPLVQHASIPSVINIYKENIVIFWQRKLCMKSWSSLEYL